MIRSYLNRQRRRDFSFGQTKIYGELSHQQSKRPSPDCAKENVLIEA